MASPVRVEADGEQFATRFLVGDYEADALVCANDELALSIMARLQAGGIDVPGDVAVVGWDDVMTARYVRPDLTTVRQPVQDLGALAADRLHDLLLRLGELSLAESPALGRRASRTSCRPNSCSAPPAAVTT